MPSRLLLLAPAQPSTPSPPTSGKRVSREIDDGPQLAIKKHLGSARVTTHDKRPVLKAQPCRCVEVMELGKLPAVRRIVRER